MISAVSSMNCWGLRLKSSSLPLSTRIRPPEGLVSVSTQPPAHTAVPSFRVYDTVLKLSRHSGFAMVMAVLEDHQKNLL